VKPRDATLALCSRAPFLREGVGSMSLSFRCFSFVRSQAHDFREMSLVERGRSRRATRLRILGYTI